MKEREHLFNEWKSEQADRKKEVEEVKEEVTPVKEPEREKSKEREKTKERETKRSGGGERERSRERDHSRDRDRKDSKDSKKIVSFGLTFRSLCMNWVSRDRDAFNMWKVHRLTAVTVRVTAARRVRPLGFLNNVLCLLLQIGPFTGSWVLHFTRLKRTLWRCCEPESVESALIPPGVRRRSTLLTTKGL